MHGVPTRSVDDLVKAMGMSGVSKSQVSRLCGELDERVGKFLNRAIEGDWPYLWIDATYVKTREAGSIVSVAVIVAVAVNTDGQCQVIGMKVGPRLVGAMLLEQNDEWSLNRRYMQLEGLQSLSDTTAARVSAVQR